MGSPCPMLEPPAGKAKRYQVRQVEECSCDGSNNAPYLPAPTEAKTAPSLHRRPSQLRIRTSLDNCGYEGCIVCFRLEPFQRPCLFLRVCRKPIRVRRTTLEQVRHDDEARNRGSEKICTAKGGLAEAKGIEGGDDGAGGRFGACDVFDGGEAVSVTVNAECKRISCQLTGFHIA